MSDTREYRDIDGNVCELGKLVRIEPEWAANQIRHRDRIERDLAAARDKQRAILRRIFGPRYEANANEDAEMAVAHVMQQLAAARAELEKAREQMANEQRGSYSSVVRGLRAELDGVRQKIMDAMGSGADESAWPPGVNWLDAACAQMRKAAGVEG